MKRATRIASERLLGAVVGVIIALAIGYAAGTFLYLAVVGARVVFQ